MKIKYTISLCALVALTGASCWGAAESPLLDAMIVATRNGDANRVRQMIPVAITANAPFDDLPPEVITQIAGFLDDKSLMQLAQVSSKFNKIVINMPEYKKAKEENDRQRFIKALNNPSSSESIKLLQEGTINVNMPINDDGETALIWATFASRDDIINLLLQYGKNLNVNATDNKGNTALFWAISRGWNHIAIELLKHGAIPSKMQLRKLQEQGIIQELFNGAISDAISRGDMRGLIQMLKGEIIDEDMKEMALIEAIKSCNKDVAKLLIDHGADISELPPDMKQKFNDMIMLTPSSRTYSPCHVM